MNEQWFPLEIGLPAALGMPYVSSNNPYPAFSWEAWAGIAGVNEKRKGIGRRELDTPNPGGWSFRSKESALPVTETWDSRGLQKQREWRPKRWRDLVIITQPVLAVLGLGLSVSDLKPKALSSPPNSDLSSPGLGPRTWTFPSWHTLSTGLWESQGENGCWES